MSGVLAAHSNKVHYRDTTNCRDVSGGGMRAIGGLIVLALAAPLGGCFSLTAQKEVPEWAMAGQGQSAEQPRTRVSRRRRSAASPRNAPAASRPAMSRCRPSVSARRQACAAVWSRQSDELQPGMVRAGKGRGRAAAAEHEHLPRVLSRGAVSAERPLARSGI